MGALPLTWSTPFVVPVTVLLLSFIIGLQIAEGSKTSGGSIRTAHMTGSITVFGMALGNLFYWKARRSPQARVIKHERARMKSLAGLVVKFVVGRWHRQRQK